MREGDCCQYQQYRVSIMVSESMLFFMKFLYRIFDGFALHPVQIILFFTASQFIIRKNRYRFLFIHRDD